MTPTRCPHALTIRDASDRGGAVGVVGVVLVGSVIGLVGVSLVDVDRFGGDHRMAWGTRAVAPRAPPTTTIGFIANRGAGLLRPP